MMKLNDRKWKEFFIKDIVSLKKNGKQLQVPTGSNVSKSRLKKGTIPRITVTSRNNGIDSFYEDSNLTREYENFISVSFLGDAFYHPYKASTDMKVHTFQLARKQLTRYTGLFIITMLKNNTKNSSYGYQLSSTDLPLKKILLPVNSQGEPDYEFMEEYIKEKERNLKDRYKEYIKSHIKELQKTITENKDWKEFFIAEIFQNIERGKRLTRENQQEGNIPYVSSSAQNNGIDNFISNARNVRKYKNCLSLANSGSVGACFYEPFEFVASDHITALKGEYSKYTYLFIACMLNRLSEKYNFNREINDKRIKREKIHLPTTLDGNPDYKYMEDYMRCLEQKKILQYLNYISRTSSD